MKLEPARRVMGRHHPLKKGALEKGTVPSPGRDSPIGNGF